MINHDNFGSHAGKACFAKLWRARRGAEAVAARLKKLVKPVDPKRFDIVRLITRSAE